MPRSVSRPRGGNNPLSSAALYGDDRDGRQRQQSISPARSGRGRSRSIRRSRTREPRPDDLSIMKEMEVAKKNPRSLLSYRPSNNHDVGVHFAIVNELLLGSIMDSNDIDKVVRTCIELNIKCLMDMTKKTDAIESYNGPTDIKNFLWDISSAAWNLRKRVVDLSHMDENGLSLVPGFQQKKRSVSRSRSRRRGALDKKDIEKMAKAMRGEQISDDEDKDSKHITDLQSIISRRNLEFVNTRYLPEAKEVVKLSEAASKAKYHPETQRKMYISPHPLDDKRWYPAYVGQSLSTTQRKLAIKKREESEKGPSTELIQLTMGFWMAHVVADVIPVEAALQTTAITVEMATEYGRDKTYHYLRRMVEYLKHEIQSNEVVDIARFICKKQDSILVEAERNQEIQRIKGGGKGKYPYPQQPKVDDNCHHRRKEEYPKPRYPRNPSRSRGREPIRRDQEKRRKEEDDKHICFRHDPRNNRTCTDRACKRQHINTNIPKNAERYDRVKKLASENYRRKNGRV